MSFDSIQNTPIRYYYTEYVLHSEGLDYSIKYEGSRFATAVTYTLIL